MAEVKKQKQNEENEQIEESPSESDDDEAYNESFYVADKSRPHGNKYTTWVIEGVFNCDYELDNTFFPCMTIKSGLKIIIHNQIYKKTKIEYSFMNCLAENKLGIKVFDFKLNQKVHKTFGIYTLNLNSASC